MGGLTVARAAQAQLPDAHFVYAADNAGFPYGAWKEDRLTARIVAVMGELIARSDPHIIVIACNTASTIALARLREVYNLPFVGTVPAIKPAAAQTISGIIGVLATPGTVSREYTQALIREHAHHCEVILHGAPRLAEMAERKLHGYGIDLGMLRQEVTPVFREIDGKRTDIVVLACTHYPLITEDIAEVAPWPVSYLDPAPAIARRIASVLKERPLGKAREGLSAHGTVLLTAAVTTPEELAAYGAMGFVAHEVLGIAV
jgi:glutamate racemase